MKRPAIKLDPRNARVHNDADKAGIRQSIETLGAGRSIVTDRDGVVIAGNGVYEQAKALGMKVRVIDSDGTHLIAVKRTDLTAGDPRRTALAIADNQLASLSAWDVTTLADLRAGLDKSLEEAAGFGLQVEPEGWGAPPPDGGNSAADTPDKCDTNLSLGDFSCRVTRAEYETLIESIRQEVGFDESAVIAELLRRIGA